jgi:hypothetical protein
VGYPLDEKLFRWWSLVCHKWPEGKP